VAKAIQERDRLVNEAEADALRTVRRAQEEAERTLKRAGVDAHARLEAAKADRDAFLAWHAVRHRLTPAEEDALAREREQRLRAGETAVTVDAELAARRARVLADRRLLIENRLMVEAVVEVLKSRDKVLIDTGDVPGRRHLFLVDPDLIRLPSLIAPRAGEREP
jgi:Cu+-exporting ATPase